MTVAVDLYVAESELHGMGVHARRAVAEGEEIERCPVLVLPAEDLDAISDTALAGYWFDWSDGDGALALGYGSLYNHSFTPNARYFHEHDDGVVVYVALRDIAAGEEITINYNAEPECTDPLWFDVA